MFQQLNINVSNALFILYIISFAFKTERLLSALIAQAVLDLVTAFLDLDLDLIRNIMSRTTIWSFS